MLIRPSLSIHSFKTAISESQTTAGFPNQYRERSIPIKSNIFCREFSAILIKTKELNKGLFPLFLRACELVKGVAVMSDG